jgi:hypothetical protein
MGEFIMSPVNYQDGVVPISGQDLSWYDKIVTE